MKNWDIARRDLLKSLGIGAACLPLLSFSKAWGQTAGGDQNRKRFFIIHATAGYWMANWKPADGPLTGTLPSSLQPLDPYKSDLIVLHSMANPEYKVGSNWGHECYGTIYWGGAQKAPGGSKYQEPAGKTLDQWVADGLPKNPMGRSTLNWQDRADAQPRAGTTGSIRCFWKGEGQPINPEINPSKTYADLFAGRVTAPPTTGTPMSTGTGPDPAVAKMLAQKKSVLDYVGTSLEKFAVRVGKQDKQIIQGHLNSIRDLENEIAGTGGGSSGGGGTGGMLNPINAMDPGKFDDMTIMSDPGVFPKVMDAYMDMMIVALSAGLSRVATLQLANSSGNSLNFGLFVPGIPARGTGYKSPFRNWHDLGHNPSMGGVNHKVIVDKWCMDKFATFLGKLKSVQEPNGKTLLDNSLVLWGNHMESGDNHGSQKIPWLLAGKAQDGKLKLGQCKGGGEISGAMGDICKAMGVTGAPHMMSKSVGII
jgi:hypothetical protein